MKDWKYYTGMILGVLGSILAAGLVWLSAIVFQGLDAVEHANSGRHIWELHSEKR